MLEAMDELESLKIEVVYLPIERDGYYIPDANMIIINQDLSSTKANEVLLHELAHAKMHKDYKTLYSTKVYHDANFVGTTDSDFYFRFWQFWE